jgi:hypothetical protein
MIARACMIGLGFAAIGLGFKGFTRDGIPFSTGTNITGPAAAIVGIGCMLVGFVLIAAGISPSTFILMLLGES